jgi:putative oxidoreductase
MASKALCTVSKIEEFLLRILDYLGDVVLFLTRVYWGYQFHLTGIAKLKDIPRFTKLFTGWGVPYAALNVHVAGSVECYGGLLLAFGFLSRPVSVLLSGTMCVAYLTAHIDTLQKMFVRPTSLDALLNAPEAFTGAAPFVYLLVSSLVVSFGPGLFSVDAFLGRLMRGWLSRHPRLAALWLGRTTAARVAPHPESGVLDGCRTA